MSWIDFLFGRRCSWVSELVKDKNCLYDEISIVVVHNMREKVVRDVSGGNKLIIHKRAVFSLRLDHQKEKFCLSQRLHPTSQQILEDADRLT